MTQSLTTPQILFKDRDLDPKIAAVIDTGSSSEIRSTITSHAYPSETDKHITLFKIAVIAAKQNNPDLLEFCISQGLPIETDSLNSDLTHAAAESASIPIYRALISHGWDINKNVSEFYGDALSMAVWKGNLELATFLLDNGANPNTGWGHNVWTALCDAVEGENQSIEMLELLLKKGGKPKGTGALCIAGRFGKLEEAKLLLKYGADVDAVEFYEAPPDGEEERRGSPFFMACEGGHTELAEFLLGQGADPTFKDGSGRSALDAAREFGKGEVVAMLERRGARE